MSATVLVWIASVVGAFLFAGVGFLLARLSGESPPPVAHAEGAQEAARSAELAKLRLELDARIQRVATLDVAAETAATEIETQRAEASRRIAETEQLRGELAVAQQAMQLARERAQTAQQQAVTAQQARDAASQAASAAASVAEDGALRTAKRELEAAKREGENAKAERDVMQGERDREKLAWRRREGELEAILESLTKERDSAFQQIAELERLVGAMDDEPTNIELSSAQFELLKDMLKKAEARASALAAEVEQLHAEAASGEFEDPDKTRRKPSTLMGMKPPTDEAGPLETSEFDRPQTLLGIQDPTKLYREAQAEIDKVRAELEKALFEVQYWKNQTEKLTVDAASSRRRQTVSSPPQARGRARASVGLKPTATTGRATMDLIDPKDEPAG